MVTRAYPNLNLRAQEAISLNQLYKSVSLEVKCRCMDRECETIAEAVDVIERYESIMGRDEEKVPVRATSGQPKSESCTRMSINGTCYRCGMPDLRMSGSGQRPEVDPGIPEYYTHVIGELKKRSELITWTLHGDEVGVTLTLRLPVKSPEAKCGHVHMRWHPDKLVNTDTLSREQDYTNQSCAVPDKTPSRGDTYFKTRKSPSCKRRDRNRKR
jgi:hypothetical protein